MSVMDEGFGQFVITSASLCHKWKLSNGCSQWTIDNFTDCPSLNRLKFWIFPGQKLRKSDRFQPSAIEASMHQRRDLRAQGIESSQGWSKHLFTTIWNAGETWAWRVWRSELRRAELKEFRSKLKVINPSFFDFKGRRLRVKTGNSFNRWIIKGTRVHTPSQNHVQLTIGKGLVL